MLSSSLVRKSEKGQVTYLSRTPLSTEKYYSYMFMCLLGLVVDLAEEVTKLQAENTRVAEECARLAAENTRLSEDHTGSETTR
jgi:hypothetical protein